MFKNISDCRVRARWENFMGENLNGLQEVLDTNKFGEAMSDLGYEFFSGVPCSYLNSLINLTINEYEFVMAANEGDAVAICAGAFLSGKKSVFICQNSGLTNAMSPLTSLNYTFQIPVLGFVSLRGEKGLKDEPQHELMGKITTEILDSMNIKWEILSKDLSIAVKQLYRANDYIENNKSFFFIVSRGTFTPVKLKEPTSFKPINKIKKGKSIEDARPIRREVLKSLNESRQKNTIVITTTGLTSRELYEIEDAPNNFYMVGSMGCVGSIALGLSLSTNKEIMTIDGDGAFLMRMGAIATIGYFHPSNLFYLLLDNNEHNSTGGQKTVSDIINFIELASSVGFERSVYLHNIEELEIELKKWRKGKALTFAYMRISSDKENNSDRPKIKPKDVKNRLMSYIRGDYYGK